MNNTQPTTQMDPQIIALAKAIRKTESNDNFNAKGKSGEFGAYQFMPNTWKQFAKESLGDANAPMTPANQNAVAYTMLKKWKDSGLNPAEIAAKWNSGSHIGWEEKIGTNSMGVKYNVPAYVKSVTDTYQQMKAGDTQAPQIPNSSTVQEPTPAPTTGFLGTNPNDTMYGKIIDNSITRGIQEFFPGQKVGQAIGTLGGYLASDNKEQYDLSAPTPLQVAGDIAQGALAVGTALPGGTSVSAFGKAVPVMNTAKTALGRIGQNVVTGSAFNTAGALKEGVTDVGDITTSAAIGGVVGGTLSGVGEVVSKVLTKLPTAMMNQTFKSPLGEVKKNITLGEDSFGRQVLDHGIIGTNKQVYLDAIKKVEQNEGALQDLLKTFDASQTGLTKPGDVPKGLIDKSDIVPYFKDLIVRLKGTPGMSDEVKLVQKVFDELPDNMTLSQGNVIKRNLYYELGNPAYKLDANLSTKREAMKTLARGLKDVIEKKTAVTGQTGSVVNHLNKELAFFGKLRDRALTNMAKGSNIGLNDIALVGVGQSMGGPGLALGAEALKKGYGTTIGKTAIAQGLNKINKAEALKTTTKLVGRVATDKASR